MQQVLRMLQNIEKVGSVPVLAKSGDDVLALVHDEVYSLCSLTRYGRIDYSNFLSGFHGKYRN